MLGMKEKQSSIIDVKYADLDFGIIVEQEVKDGNGRRNKTM